MSRYRSSQSYKVSSSNTALLEDNSWIKKPDDEYEAVDRDPNFAKTVLGRNRSSGTLSSEGQEIQSTRTTTTSSSVQALAKRFSGTQDELSSSSTPYTRSTYSFTKSESPSSTTITETKNGTTTETTMTTRSSVNKTPTKTETFSERVQSSSKGFPYSTYSSVKQSITTKQEAEDLVPSTVSTTKTVTVKSSTNDAEDKLYDTLIPKSIADNDDTDTAVYTVETVTVKESPNGDEVKTSTTSRTSSTAEDDLYDTLLPKAIKTTSSSPVSSDRPSLTSPTSTLRYSSEDISIERRRSSYSRPNSGYEYSSPTDYTSSLYRRSEDMLSDPTYTKSSVKNRYSERTVLEKDLCTYCRKPFTGDAKMVLDDMKINCHASCFKCEVCNSDLGHLKAGDSLWIYKHMVYCVRCIEITKEKWRH